MQRCYNGKETRRAKLKWAREGFLGSSQPSPVSPVSPVSSQPQDIHGHVVETPPLKQKRKATSTSPQDTPSSEEEEDAQPGWSQPQDIHDVEETPLKQKRKSSQPVLSQPGKRKSPSVSPSSLVRKPLGGDGRKDGTCGKCKRFLAQMRIRDGVCDSCHGRCVVCTHKKRAGERFKTWNGVCVCQRCYMLKRD